MAAVTTRSVGDRDAGVGHRVAEAVEAQLGGEDPLDRRRRRRCRDARGRCRWRVASTRAAVVVAADEVDVWSVGSRSRNTTGVPRSSSWRSGAPTSRSRRHDDQAVDPAGDEGLDELVLAVGERRRCCRRARGDSRSRATSSMPRRIDGEERVGHVDEDEPDRPGAGAALAQAGGPDRRVGSRARRSPPPPDRRARRSRPPRR